MTREQEFEKVKEIIKQNYNSANFGLFNTANFVGDPMTTVFCGEHFTLDICFYYSYFELFGTTDDEWQEIKQLYNSLESEEN